MAKIELVIFDFDGTLVDTAPDLIRSANFFLESQGFESLSEERIRSEIGMGLRKLLIDVYPGLNKDDEDLKRRIEGDFMAIYDREFLSSPQLYPGAFEFLQEWEGQIAIVSNKRIRYIHPILDKLGLSQLPWVRVIGGDTYPNMKPHPEPMLAAIEGAGVTPEETLIVGDGAPDVEGALAVGSLCLAVEFGYTPYQELIDLGAYKSLEHFDQLHGIIAQLN